MPTGRITTDVLSDSRKGLVCQCWGHGTGCRWRAPRMKAEDSHMNRPHPLTMMQRPTHPPTTRCRAIAVFLAASVVSSSGATASQVNIPGPVGSERFGETVQMLSDGNFVVIDTGFDGEEPDSGAIYLYSQAGTQIAALVGKRARDFEDARVYAAKGGGYYVVLPNWDRSAAAINAGAVLSCPAAVGCSGEVSSANALVGTQADDGVGLTLYRHADGSAAAIWPSFSTASANSVGAVTFLDGLSALAGEVGEANALIGAETDDLRAASALRLASGLELVVAPYASNRRGAVLMHRGATDLGVMDDSIGLFGRSPGDASTGFDVTALATGGYVVKWDSFDLSGGAIDVGALVVCPEAGCTGVLQPAMALTGRIDGDLANSKVVPLANGNAVLFSPSWHDSTGQAVGASTWISKKYVGGGVVSEANSLYGSAYGDGLEGYAESLPNGNYLVALPNFDLGLARQDAGRVAVVNGESQESGPLGARGMYGANPADKFGARVDGGSPVVLDDGSFVIVCRTCDNESLVNAGAVSWGDAEAPTSYQGEISTVNALMGTAADEGRGLRVTSVKGGYVVASPFHGLSGRINAGAVTMCMSPGGCVGTQVESNSLYGAAAYDHVGMNGVVALDDGGYVVVSPLWQGGRGAVTWCDTRSSCGGAVSPTNSLQGSAADAQLGSGGVLALKNGEYLVSSPMESISASYGGAVTIGRPRGSVGSADFLNSVYGTSANDAISGRASGIVDPSRPDVQVLEDGNILVRSPDVDNGPATDAGALTLLRPAAGFLGGALGTTVSVRGSVPNEGESLRVTEAPRSMEQPRTGYDPSHRTLVVGRPRTSIVSLISLGPAEPTDRIFADNFE